MILFQSGLSEGPLRQWAPLLGDLMPAYAPKIPASFLAAVSEAASSGAFVFFDSGMYSVDVRSKKFAKSSSQGRWAYYDTLEFHQYMDAYAAFAKAKSGGGKLYASCDAIGNPELSWRNQRYLEKTHQAEVVPVIHQGTDPEWLKHYLSRGRHEVIGLGWLTTAAGSEAFYKWLDAAFSIVCPPPKREPVVKVHGFGMSNPKFMLRYPWWSVDGSSWVKQSAYGHVLIPFRSRGKWLFDREPMGIAFTPECEDVVKGRSRHYLTMPPAAKRVLFDWLDEIGVPLGDVDNPGVTSDNASRCVANLHYHRRFVDALPPYPDRFKVQARRTIHA